MSQYILNNKTAARERKKKKNHFIKILLILLLLSCVALSLKWILDHDDIGKILNNQFDGQINISDDDMNPLISRGGKYKVNSSLNTESQNAILIHIGVDEEILFEKGSEKRIYPASMTKIMTAILTLESVSDLNETVTLSEDIYTKIYAENAATAGFLPKEEVEVVDLLYGLMLPSGAECAAGLAEYTTGSEELFVKQMNKKAQQLGMNDTNFVNASGLHNNNHYSTVSDFSILLKYALNNKDFYKIFTASRHSTKPTNLHSDGITFYSTLFENLNPEKFKRGAMLGGKTGYTNEAGQCLASLLKKDDELFILITTGAFGNYKKEFLHIDDALTIFKAIETVE